jgi:hypothetical protein
MSHYLADLERAQDHRQHRQHKAAVVHDHHGKVFESHVTHLKTKRRLLLQAQGDEAFGLLGRQPKNLKTRRFRRSLTLHAIEPLLVSRNGAGALRYRPAAPMFVKTMPWFGRRLSLRNLS